MADLRAFIGIPVVAGLADIIESWLPSAPIPKDVVLRESPRSNWHVTLHFFGPKTDDDRLLAAWHKCIPVISRMHAPEIVPKALVGLPMNHSHAWVLALEPTVELLDLQSRLCAQLQILGFDVEDRPYFPHITLWRPRGRQHINLPCFDVELPRMQLKQVALYRSDARSDGSVYSIIDQCCLRDHS